MLNDLIILGSLLLVSAALIVYAGCAESSDDERSIPKDD